MPIPTLTNGHPNPSLETALSNWSANNATVVRDGAWAYEGSWSAKLTPTGVSNDTRVTLGSTTSLLFGLTAGGTFTVSVMMRLSAPLTGDLATNGRRIYVVPYLAGGPASNDQWTYGDVAPNEAGVHLLTARGSLPADAVGYQIRISHGGSSGAGDVWLDVVTITPGEADTGGRVFSGATPADSTYTYAWTGTAHASTSVATPKPYVDATLFPDSARASVNLDWSNTTGVPATALVERVNADGTVAPVRGADPATLVGGQWVGDDYEAPLDEPFYYQVTSTDKPGTVLTSPSYTLDSGGLTWLKHPGRPFLNTTVHVTRGPDFARPVEQGVFDVLGRSRPVATSMLRRSERGELALFTATANERTALLALVQDGVPLLLSTPSGYGVGNVYVSVGDVEERRIGQAGRQPARYWSLPITVVDRPSGGALAAGNSWSDVLGTYSSWSQLLATEGTWTGVLEGVD